MFLKKKQIKHISKTLYLIHDFRFVAKTNQFINIAANFSHSGAEFVFSFKSGSRLNKAIK